MVTGQIRRRDIEAIREYFDHNPQNAYKLGYIKEELKDMGIFDEKELEEEDDWYDSED